MIRKFGVLLGALSLAYPIEAKAPGLTTYEAVKQVRCGRGSGTAFRVRGGDFVSAAHVTTIGGCTINDTPIEGAVEGDLDVAIIKGLPNDGPSFPINCEGMTPNTYVFAVGYAAGFPWQTMTRLLVTAQRSPNGFVGLYGTPTVVPGMSGGVVINEAGEAVGVINMFTPFGPWSLSRSLSDTSLCK